MRTTTGTATAILLTLPLSSACIPTITDDLSLISSPRLLAIAAQPAEAAPSDGVALSALVAAPAGARRASIEWELCTSRKPLTELGAVNPACLSPTRDMDASVERLLGQGDEIASDVPRDACSSFGPNPPPPQAGEQTGGRPVDPDPTGGYYQPVVAFLGRSPTLGTVRLSCGVPGLSPDERVEFGQRYRINENPRIDALHLGDGTVVPSDAADAGFTARRKANVSLETQWAACPRHSVCGDGICGEEEDATSCAGDCPAGASKGCTGAETYAWFDPGAEGIEDRREGILVTWYSTAGAFSERRVGVAETDPDAAHTKTTWTAPATPGEETLWAVIRDDRGGVSWQSYRVRVE